MILPGTLLDLTTIHTCFTLSNCDSRIMLFMYETYWKHDNFHFGRSGDMNYRGILV